MKRDCGKNEANGILKGCREAEKWRQSGWSDNDLMFSCFSFVKQSDSTRMVKMSIKIFLTFHYFFGNFCYTLLEVRVWI